MELIRIKKEDYNKDIFRIFPMHWFLEVLERRKLAFAKPKLWRDPMDRLIFEHYFTATEKGQRYGEKDSYFAQCWTLTYESHALWNEYAPLHNGVRVRTTIGKLIDLFKHHPLTNGSNTWCIGSVDYLPIEQIRSWLEKDFPYNNEEFRSPAGQARTLLIKLNQYSHEQEVRIIFNCNGQKNDDPDIYKEIAIEPLELFDKLLLDPRMPENIYQVFREKFLRYGFKEDQVMRSALYDEELLKQKILPDSYYSSPSVK